MIDKALRGLIGCFQTGRVGFCVIELLLSLIFIRGSIEPSTKIIPKPNRLMPINVKSLKAAPHEGLLFWRIT